MATYYPPVSFYFKVKFADVTTAEDASFSEVSGLDAERPVVEIKEGGENRYTHRVPGRAQYANLVLKRGLLVWTSELATWCSAILESDLATPLAPKDIDVALLDINEVPLMKWNFKRAWPVKWSVSALAADKNDIAVETLELAYAYFTRVAQPLGQKYLAAAT
jgi:phage tail-like protein